MRVRIREYRASDRSCIVKFIEQSQDYLTAVDQMKRTRRMPDYGERYTRKLFEEIDNSDGVT